MRNIPEELFNVDYVRDEGLIDDPIECELVDADGGIEYYRVIFKYKDKYYAAYYSFSEQEGSMYDNWEPYEVEKKVVTVEKWDAVDEST